MYVYLYVQCTWRFVYLGATAPPFNPTYNAEKNPADFQNDHLAFTNPTAMPYAHTTHPPPYEQPGVYESSRQHDVTAATPNEYATISNPPPYQPSTAANQQSIGQYDVIPTTTNHTEESAQYGRVDNTTSENAAVSNPTYSFPVQFDTVQ